MKLYRVFAVALPFAAVACVTALAPSVGRGAADTGKVADTSWEKWEGKRATTLLFVGTECPISNRYTPEYVVLAREYAARGVAVVLVYSNTGTTPEAAAKHAAAYGLKGLPRLLDTDQRLADRFGATLTPEAVVLDVHRKVRYRGRVDDGYAARGKAKGTGASRRDLRDALDAILANKPVKTPRTQVVGCAIERTKPVSASASALTGPTYAADIAPIVSQNCQSCHRPGEIGPMPLVTYEDAKRWAVNIAQVTSEKQMPPWKPVSGHGQFLGERRLTEAQILTLGKWAKAGAPRGDVTKLPPAPKYPEGWTLGKPDLVLNMPSKWRVAPSGPDVYRCFVLPTSLAEDKDVVAVQFRAGNKSVVHHVLGYIDTTGKAREKDAADEGAGYTSFGGPGFLPSGELGGWAPGNIPRFLPEGIGRTLPAGSDVVIQVHYHPTGKSEDDITSVGLYFAKKPITKRLRTLPLAIRRLDIPPGEASHKVSQTYPVPFDATAISITPHMHFLGKFFEMKVTLPDGTEQPLVRIDDWDFQWQDSYFYRQPLKLPQGSRITLEATFDNSEANPRNPHSPPQRVTWGEKTTDEMCIGFLSFITDDESSPLLRLMDRRRNGTAPTR